MKTSFRLLALALVALALSSSPAAAADQADPACTLFSVDAASVQKPVAQESQTPAPLAVSLACSAICSYSDCLGAWDGAPCVRFNGNPGTCRISGRSCSPQERHCSCS
jgi:hypothetical protein